MNWIKCEDKLYITDQSTPFRYRRLSSMDYETGLTRDERYFINKIRSDYLDMIRFQKIKRNNDE